MGAAHVIVVEPNPYRRAQAEKIGALAMPPGDEVIQRCRELTGRRGGFDVALECSGASRCASPLHPDWFDLVVASNLVGDIQSDLGPASTGTHRHRAERHRQPRKERSKHFGTPARLST